MDKTRTRDYLLLGLAAFIAGLVYISSCLNLAGCGFPLDDAWIHQAFARNLAATGTWSFQLNQPSGGSTGPAWGFILALLYVLRIPTLPGTLFVGWGLLWAAAAAAYHLFEKIFPENRWYAVGAGALIALEWHVAWAAFSGMETILLIFLSLLLFNWLFFKREDWWIPGLLIGISAWIRPDGLSLIGPAALVLLARHIRSNKLLIYLLSLAGGLIAGAAPYFLFNWLVAGDIWPNTFYAKQAEYAVLLLEPFLSRYFRVGLQFVVGPGALLVPGILLGLVEDLKGRRWERLAALVWSAGYLGIYAWKLPVVYQHGRYIMPALPIAYLLGAAGMTTFLRSRGKLIWGRVVGYAWLASTAVTLGIFLILGGKAYGMDVAVINTEMVRTALWVEDNIEPEALVAAHDIGALGYFSSQRILDLAGLVTPDVIPFIRDEVLLREYVDEQGARYLVAFPDWYPELTAGLEVIYSSEGEYASRFGSQNMAVFRLK